MLAFRALLLNKIVIKSHYCTADAIPLCTQVTLFELVDLLEE